MLIRKTKMTSLLWLITHTSACKATKNLARCIWKDTHQKTNKRWMILISQALARLLTGLRRLIQPEERRKDVCDFRATRTISVCRFWISRASRVSLPRAARTGFRRILSRNQNTRKQTKPQQDWSKVPQKRSNQEKKPTLWSLPAQQTKFPEALEASLHQLNISQRVVFASKNPKLTQSATGWQADQLILNSKATA